MSGWCKACSYLPAPGDPHVMCLRHTVCFKKTLFTPSSCPACRLLYRRADSGSEFARGVWRKRLARMKTMRRESVEIPWNKIRYVFNRRDAVRFNPLWARVNIRGMKRSASDKEMSSSFFQEYDDADGMDDAYDDEQTDKMLLRSSPPHQWTSDVNSMTGGQSSYRNDSEGHHTLSRRSGRPPVKSFDPSFHEVDQRFSNDPPCLEESDDDSYNVPCLCPRDTSSGSSHPSCSDRTHARTSDVLPMRKYSELDDRRHKILEKKDHSSAEGTGDTNICDIVCEKLQTLEKNIQQFIATRESDIPNISRKVEGFYNKNSIPSIKICVADCSQPDQNEVNSSTASSTAPTSNEANQDWFLLPKVAKVLSISPLVVKYGATLLGQDDIDIKVFAGETFYKILNPSLKVLNFKKVSINESSITKLMTLHESQLREICGWSLGHDSNEILIEDISHPVSSVIKLVENCSADDLNLYHKNVSSIVSLKSSERSSDEFVGMLQAPKLKPNPFKPNSTTSEGIFSNISVDLRDKEFRQRKLAETSFKTIEGLECAAKMLHNLNSFSEASSPADYEAFSKRVGDFLTALAHQQTPLLAHHLSKVLTIRKIMRSELTSEAKPLKMVSKLMSAPLIGKELFSPKMIAKVLKSQARPSDDSMNDLEEMPEVLFDYPMESNNDVEKSNNM